uniref:Myb-like domain-containing protein n=1 Tax=Globisporangium ultimum (strain ATCC 200006 / CBS 805.95 / DAOM BR144) TaxID=431595 RepID=K3WDQ3_GLOUD
MSATATRPAASEVALLQLQQTQRRNERRRLSAEGLGVWTKVEHARFLEGKRLFPNGPWKRVAEFVGTRNTRQTMTHAQKFRQKLERRQRGLRTTRRISDDDHESDEFCNNDTNTTTDEMHASSEDIDIETAQVHTPRATTHAHIANDDSTTLRFVSFEQLLKDSTVDIEPACYGYSDGTAASTGSSRKYAAESSASPTHHGDPELPWLDECLDFFIHNLS